MNSCASMKFNNIFRDLFPKKEDKATMKHDESRFASFFKDLKDTHTHTQWSPTYSIAKTSDRSPSPSSYRNECYSPVNQWSLDLRKILLNEDRRTTLMIKNIPNKFSREKLLNIINEKFQDRYDIYVLPTDTNGTKNFGYGFINLKSHFDVIPFFQEFHGSRWAYTKSEKICEISYSKIQGQEKLLNHYPPKHIYLNRPYPEVNLFPQSNGLRQCINPNRNTFLSSIAYNNERFFILNQSTSQLC